MSKLNQFLSFNKRSSRLEAGKKSKFLFRILAGVVCAILLIISVGILGVSAIKLGSGVTIASPSPTRFIRVQLVNATGGYRTELYELTQMIKQLSDSLIEISVVDQSNFITRVVDRSLVISRDVDLSAAEYIADKLGLDPEQVEYNPMEINSRQVTVSLVVGQDLIADLISATGKKGKK